ncbi:MAG: 16S rRNA (uracil(1498)-N(3))-methyltransferase [Fibrobacter sp.]|nr:16S rRNA (uracil(1498)-N(3))-methyltransferase [Fibrobacter sp.]
MNLVLLYESDFTDRDKKSVSVRGKRMEHILSVIRAGKGNEIKVGLLDGASGTACITEVNEHELLMEVFLTQEPLPFLPLTLILALPRPKTLRKTIEAATSLGIKKIFIIESWRVEKNYWSSPVLNDQNLFKFMINGLQQARDTILPKIEIRKRFKPFVEDEIPEIIKNTIPFVAHPYSKTECPHKVTKPVTLALGPEGGFIPYEVELLQHYGFQPVTIGDRVLRVEYALPVLAGKLF